VKTILDADCHCMSWHFSQALVEEYLEESSTDGEQFVLLKSSDMPETYCWLDKTTECLSLFQYGTMCDPSTENLGGDLFKWYQVDFLARTSAQREQCGDARGWMVNGPVYGGRCCALLPRWNLPMFSGKTRQLCAQTDLTKSSTNLPPSGMYADGSLSELMLSDLITEESDYGSMLPTPTARDWKDTAGMGTERNDGKTRLDRMPMLLFESVRDAGISLKSSVEHTGAQIVKLMDLAEITISGQDYCPELPEWMMGLPIGWTELKPLETDRFQQWLLLHGKYLE